MQHYLKEMKQHTKLNKQNHDVCYTNGMMNISWLKIRAVPLDAIFHIFNYEMSRAFVYLNSSIEYLQVKPVDGSIKITTGK